MLKNHLTLALRHLRNHKGYALINILGLALGLTCCLLILLYVHDELRYDQHHENAPRLYRVAQTATAQGKASASASTPAPLGPALLDDYPEIANMARFFPLTPKPLVRYGEKRFYEEKIIVADASLLDLFTLPLIRGDAQTALNDPYAILITERIAEKYFGTEDPLGKTLIFRETTAYRVTGVLQDLPAQSHFSFEMVVPLSQATIAQFQYDNFLHEWWDASAYTYLLLHAGQTPTTLQDKLPAVLEKHVGDQFEAAGLAVSFFLQPVVDIHLHSHLGRELGANGHVAYTYIFTTIALLILLISIINFVNLSTARSLIRAREVGVRKAVGAHRKQLCYQFIGEAMLVAFMALLAALALIALALEPFNAITGKALTLSVPLQYMLGLPLLAALLGLMAGGYPAFVLASFDPITALKGFSSGQSKGRLLRQGLVVSQFAIAIALIIALLVVNNQQGYLQDKALGFDKEEVVVITLNDLDLRWQSETVKTALLALPTVSQVTFSQVVPGLSKIEQGYGAQGIDGLTAMNTLLTDVDFLRTYDIDLVAGRDFSAEQPTDRTSAFIINEAAAKHLGWEDPLGNELRWGVTQKTGAVIGVIRDFHFQSLHHQIDPLIIHIEPIWYRYLSVKTSTEDLAHTMAQLENVWHTLSPDYPFDYFFLDEHIGQLYVQESRLNAIIGSFSGLALLITCLGLFGLAAFTAEQRTKEIGIRKVLGASVTGLLMMLYKDFTTLVGLGFVLAAPVAYLVMNRWLADFAYRTELSWWIFLAAALAALGIAALTVSYQSVKAALSNPVEALRYE